MPKFLLLFSCWLLLSGSSQTLPAAFPDTPTITENSVGKARIGMSAIKLKEAYNGFTFTPTYLAKYGFDGGSGKPDAVTVSRSGQKLFVYFLDWQTKKKVAGLIVLHSAYQTANKVHVGSTSAQLKVAIPTVKVAPDEILPEMEIAQIETREDQKPGLQYIFYKQGTIGKLKDSMEPSEIAKPNAKISWIQIYPN